MFRFFWYTAQNQHLQLSCKLKNILRFPRKNYIIMPNYVHITDIDVENVTVVIIMNVSFVHKSL